MAALPHVELLSSTNLSNNCYHSIVISVLRALAALQVVAAHVRAQFFPSLKGLEEPTMWYQVLAFFTGFAHQAVVLFFLLSGWLVGGSLLNRLHRPGALAHYAIDRVTRLWIVLIPAFVFSLVAGAVTLEIDPTHSSMARENAYSGTAFIGNLFGLQDMVVPRFGDNFALWSLANEIWYYAMFPALVLCAAGTTPATRWCSGAALLLMLACLSFPITLFFLIWLLGVGFSRVRIHAARWQRWVMLAGLLAVSVFFRLAGSNDKLVEESFVQDLVFSLVFLVLLASLQYRAGPQPWIGRLKKLGGVLAGFSFTLYVLHVPVIQLFQYLYARQGGEQLSPERFSHFGVYLVMVGMIVLCAWLFHLPFEAQTYRVRALAKRWLGSGATDGALRGVVK